MPGSSRLDNVKLAVNCCNSLGLDVYCRYTNAKPLDNMFFSPFALATGTVHDAGRGQGRHRRGDHAASCTSTGACSRRSGRWWTSSSR
ncbi:hypothetical protein MTO96_028179 [Rhipicephalus appendiculatus]